MLCIEPSIDASSQLVPRESEPPRSRSGDGLARPRRLPARAAENTARAGRRRESEKASARPRARREAPPAARARLDAP